MRRVRTTTATVIVALLLTTVLTANVATAASNVCIARYGHVIHQSGTATCFADATSVATARGDGARAVVATDGGTAIANGDFSYAEAHFPNRAVANGSYVSATAGIGLNNMAVTNGSYSSTASANGSNNTSVSNGDSNGVITGGGNENTGIANGDGNLVFAAGGNNNTGIANGDGCVVLAIGGDATEHCP